MLMPPNLYTFDDYRRYLAAWIAYKASRKGFSMRSFSRRAGFKAQNMLQLVVSGNRNLSTASIAKFSEGLGLSSEDAGYFHDLVLMNQADGKKERLSYYRRLMAHPQRQQTAPIEGATLAFFSHWLAPVIYEMTAFPRFQADVSWIAEWFDPPLETGDVRKAMQVLLDSGLIKIAPDGRWTRQTPQVETGHGVRDLQFFAYHEMALLKANDALHQVPADKRQYQVMTAAVPQSAIPELKRLAQKYEAEVWELINGLPDPADQVVQISLQMFPLLASRSGKTLRKKGK